MAPAPLLSPQEELRTFKLEPGFHAELVAGEPLVHDPVAAAFDLEGNLWVAEFSTFNGELTQYLPELTHGVKPAQVPTCKIVKLVASHHDGRFDTRIVWLEGLQLVRGLAIVHDGILISDSPNLWLARDLHHTGHCDDKVLLSDNYEADPLMQVSRRQSTWAYKPTAGDTARVYIQAEDSGSLMWGRDNIIHDIDFALDYRYRHGKLEPLNVPVRGQFGICQDDFGRLYFNSNSDQLRGDLFAPTYGTRNGNVTGMPWADVRLATDQQVWPSHTNPAVTGGYRRGILGRHNGGLRPDGRLLEFTAACSPLIYRGTNFPKDYYGNAFVPEPAGNLIKRDLLSEKDGRITAVQAYHGREFLTSTDSRFRPVALVNAPDGTMLVVDLYRGILQEYHYLTHYLESQSLGRGLEAPMFGPGRIFRIVADQGPRDPDRPDLARASAADLAAALSKPNGWWRDVAEQELVERDDRSAVPALDDLALHAPNAATRDCALWALDGLEATDLKLLAAALQDPSEQIRSAAVRLHERWLASDATAEAALRQLEPMVDDPSAEVTVQLALTLGEAKGPAALALMARLLRQPNPSPFLPKAIASGLRGREFEFFESIAGEPQPAIQTILASAIVHSGNRAAIDRLIAQVGGEGGLAPRTRLAVIAGFESLLQPAFRRTIPRSGLVMAAELAPWQRSSDARVRAAAAELVSGLQPVEAEERRRAAHAKPLSAEEQKRYEQGQLVFQVCAACHQAGGTGQANVAPSLVDSHWVGSSPALLVRIVLNGKEGTPGFAAPMPPVAVAFTDEQIASVLTYVRNSWGRHEGAVTPDLVAEVRKQNGARQTPWTNAELTRWENRLKE